MGCLNQNFGKTMKIKISGALLLILTMNHAGRTQGMPVITIESVEARLSPMLIGVASVFMKIGNTGGGDDMSSQHRYTGRHCGAAR
jgi:hypothetical protein